MDGWMRGRGLSDDTEVPWNTMPKALQEADELLAPSSGDDAVLVKEVRQSLGEMAESRGAS